MGFVFVWRGRGNTLRRENIGPFAVYSYKLEIFILLEMNLNIKKLIFSRPISFKNSGKSPIDSFLLKRFHYLNFCDLLKLRNGKKGQFIK